jgi:ribosome-associated toxin RatA of RatAB toxin-antitoxin module
MIVAALSMRLCRKSVADAQHTWIRIHSIVTLFALLAAEALPATAAPTIVTRIQRGSDAVVIEASAVLRADAATAWRVLTDYDRYAEFIPELRSSHIVARVGASVTVEQSGDAGSWLWRIPLHVTYRITEFPPYRIQSNATSTLFRALESTYRLTPSGLGVRLDYAGHLAPRTALFAPVEEVAIRQSVVRQFRALADEIENRSRSNAVTSVPR